MNKVRAIFAVLTVVTLFGTAALFCGAGGGGGKWEYTTIYGRTLDKEQFINKVNELGKEGWEAVSDVRVDTEEPLLLKRKL